MHLAKIPIFVGASLRKKQQQQNKNIHQSINLAIFHLILHSSSMLNSPPNAVSNMRTEIPLYAQISATLQARQVQAIKNKQQITEVSTHDSYVMNCSIS